MTKNGLSLLDYKLANLIKGQANRHLQEDLNYKTFQTGKNTKIVMERIAKLRKFTNIDTSNYVEPNVLYCNRCNKKIEMFTNVYRKITGRTMTKYYHESCAIEMNLLVI